MGSKKQHILCDTIVHEVFTKEKEATTKDISAILNDCLAVSPQFVELAKKHKIKVPFLEVKN